MSVATKGQTHANSALKAINEAIAPAAAPEIPEATAPDEAEPLGHP